MLTTLLAGVGAAGIGCGGSSASPSAKQDRTPGRTEFVSSAPQGQGSSRGAADSVAVGTGGAGGSASAAVPGAVPPTLNAGANAERKVEETDIYRVEGDRLYFLNGYRGLMVFDIADVDHPRLVGRSAIFGSPVEMIVRDGIATVVVADWYGHMDDGSPFHGSIVRGIDARDPVNIQILGEAKLGGWVRDTRVVGDVLYAVSEDYGWSYGWYGGGDVASSGGVSTNAGPKVVISSVSFAGGAIRSTGRFDAPGWGGVFNVTQNAILFAHDVQPSDAGYNPYAGQFVLDYVDISDPAGSIVPRGSLTLTGRLISYGTDNGRWNLDFADGKTARVLARNGYEYGSSYGNTYTLATADFSNPSEPVFASSIPILGTGWSPAARFDGTRMYLAPADNYAYYGQNNTKTPIEVYDLADAKAPRLAGQTTINGAVWNFTPAGDRLFILGNESINWTSTEYGGYYAGNRIAVNYVDVSDITKPTVLGAAAFGEGWAWTPAAGTFKAFTKNEEQKLVVLPFSGWNGAGRHYNNGLQLIEFSPSAITKAGTANTRGWVERGVFAKGRLLSLSDLSLAVIDYGDHQSPKVVSELTLARNVVDAKPHGNTVTELSGDWWYTNDVDHSELRIVPTGLVDENTSNAAVAEIAIEGTNARAFHNGTLSYVVTSVRHDVPCASQPGQPSGSTGLPDGKGDPGICSEWTEQVQVVDHVDGKVVLRGKKELPSAGSRYGYGGYPGFGGCFAYDWYYGNDVVQVGANVLAFRRWVPQYDRTTGAYVDAQSSLFVVDLANPDQPAIASTVITAEKEGWWGNMRTVGQTLYTTHYEWESRGDIDSNASDWTVKYYLDRIDLSDRAHPRVGAKINVPGMLVGGSEADPSLVYTIDYRWYGNRGGNELDVLKLHDNTAELLGSLAIPGWVGSTFIRGSKAYMSVQQDSENGSLPPSIELWQVDLSNPSSIRSTPSKAAKGWGWLLGVEGDRALVTSGWGGDGIDIYKLSEAAPTFDRFVRTVGWGSSSMARQGNQIFLASGQWGVQTIDLQ